MSDDPALPKRAYVLDLKVQADDLDSLIGYLRSFETELYMDKISIGVSGGYSSGAIYSLAVDPSITHDSWAAQLDTWLAWKDAQDALRALSPLNKEGDNG